MKSFLYDTMLGPIISMIESMFFKLVVWYDDYVYSPLQHLVSPVVARIPRDVTIGSTKYTIFSANIVSYGRTLLTIPIVWFVKYNHCWLAFSLVVLHDFLDHVDGIVAKVHRRLLGPVDDPLLGGFMDAFCDKVVNVTCLWSLLLLTNYSAMTFLQTAVYVGICAIIIIYEFILGVVRVQDYFAAFYTRKSDEGSGSATVSSTAVMEGKLKEKLESMGIAFLCLSQTSPVVMDSYSGIAGVTCLLLSIRLANASLQHKLRAREVQRSSIHKTDKPADTTDCDKATEANNAMNSMATEEHSVRTEVVSTEDQGLNSDVLSDDIRKRIKRRSRRSKKDDVVERPVGPPSRGVADRKVDKVYTVGCFDLFHYGHAILLQRMRSFGREVIVGVHDNRSIQQLKNRTPIDDTEKRMANVKKHADIVFCVAGTNPSPFLRCMFAQTKEQTCLYVRGDDMPNFPAKTLCEQHMPVRLLPYTDGVSSTKLREKFQKTKCHVKNNGFDDDDYSLFY